MLTTLKWDLLHYTYRYTYLNTLLENSGLCGLGVAALLVKDWAHLSGRIVKSLASNTLILKREKKNVDIDIQAFKPRTNQYVDSRRRLQYSGSCCCQAALIAVVMRKDCAHLQRKKSSVPERQLEEREWWENCRKSSGLLTQIFLYIVLNKGLNCAVIKR